MARNSIEAKFIADQLMEQGIPAIADKFDLHGLVGVSGDPKVRVRKDDLPRAQAWLKGYEHRHKTRRDDQE